MPETRLVIKGMVERLAKIKAEVKYAQVIKIQNNIGGCPHFLVGENLLKVTNKETLIKLQ